MCAYRLSRRLRCDFLEAITCQELGFFDSTKLSQLQNVLISDVEGLQETIASEIPTLCRFIFQFGGSMLLMISLSWKLSLIIFSCIPFIFSKLLGAPLVVFGSMAYTNYVNNFYIKFNEYLDMANFVATDIFMGVIILVLIYNRSRQSKLLERKNKIHLMRNTRIL